MDGFGPALDQARPALLWSQKLWHSLNQRWVLLTFVAVLAVFTSTAIKAGCTRTQCPERYAVGVRPRTCNARPLSRPVPTRPTPGPSASIFIELSTACQWPILPSTTKYHTCKNLKSRKKRGNPDNLRDHISTLSKGGGRRYEGGARRKGDVGNTWRGR